VQWAGGGNEDELDDWVGEGGLDFSGYVLKAPAAGKVGGGVGRAGDDPAGGDAAEALIGLLVVVGDGAGAEKSESDGFGHVVANSNRRMERKDAKSQSRKDAKIGSERSQSYEWSVQEH
jgi:hypothetical protein